MSFPPAEERRRLIPRWRRFSKTRRSAELVSDPRASVESPVESLTLEEKVKQWREDKSIETAIDLLEEAIVAAPRNSEALVAASFLVQNKFATAAVRTLASGFMRPDLKPSIEPELNLGEIDRSQHAAILIRRMRTSLREGPRNPLLWTDLSLQYLSIGQRDKAISAMESALALAKDNRYVLRVASRLFVKVNELKRAHEILRRSDLVKHDPWVLSAEIAVASMRDVTSPNFNRGRRLLRDLEDYPAFITELAGSVGTEIMKDGAPREARSLIKTSLKEPNDNVIAQAMWIWRAHPTVVAMNNNLLREPQGFEARALKAFEDSEWENVVSESQQWAQDEPFSTRPAVWGSFVTSAIFHDYERSLKIVDDGLIANPKDVTLLNNRAVSLARLGATEVAAEILSGLPKSFSDTTMQCTLEATRGLLAMRTGDIAAGRAQYQSALRSCPAHGHANARTRVLIVCNWLYEEAEAGTLDIEILTSALTQISGDFRAAKAWPDVSAIMANLGTLIAPELAEKLKLLG
ncbi:MAG: hypothetical protein AB7M05_20320 [Alphaproteobacteria bacterium]